MLLMFKNWFNLFSVMKHVFLRFPIAYAIIIFTALTALLFVNGIELFDKNVLKIIYFASAFSIVIQVALKLYVESKSWPTKKYILAVIVLMLITLLSVVVLIEQGVFSAFLSLSIASILSWMFAPYIAGKSNESSVWYFNYLIGESLFFAAISAIVFGGGLSLIVLSLSYLFEIKIDNILYADIWIVAWGILFSTYVLFNISKTYDFEDENCAFPKGVNFIANYILLPLMFAYMAVLYAYFIKIGFQWELPKGNLGWMISSLGVIGIVTKLVTFPICNKGTRLMTLFDKYFYYALIPPVIILYIAILIRIDAYGITENRYALVILAVWFSILILASIFKKQQFHIKHVPMSLALLALFSTYGPWSASEVSVNSQLHHLEILAKKHDFLIKGNFVKTNKEISFDERKKISSIVDYLGKNRWRFKQLRPRLESVISKSKNKKLISRKKISGSEILALLDIKYVSKWRSKSKQNASKYFSYANYLNMTRVMVDVSGYDYMSRRSFSLYKNSSATHKMTYEGKNQTEKLNVSINNSIVTIDSDVNENLVFNIKDIIFELDKQGVKEITESNASKLNLIKSSEDGKTKVRFIIEQVNGNILDGKLTISNLRYALLIKNNL